MQKQMSRAGVAALATTTVLGAGLVGPAYKADASVRRAGGDPITPALQQVKVPPIERRVKVKRVRLADTTPPPSGGAELDETTVTLRLTGVEAQRLRSMLHEAVTNDLDLLEDTLYQDEAVDSEAVARVALAIRLDVAMQ